MFPLRTAVKDLLMIWYISVYSDAETSYGDRSALYGRYPFVSSASLRWNYVHADHSMRVHKICQVMIAEFRYYISI